MENKKCISCSSTNFRSILDLGEQPWCNGFLKKEDFDKEKKYPLKLIQCNKCSLLQLSYFVPKEIMFKEHTYLSGITKTLAKHFYDLAEENLWQFNLRKNDFIIDIGGNDGTQLNQYQKLGLQNLLNVESAENISKLSSVLGVQTMNGFFNEINAMEIKELFGKAKLINASGVFFHLEELQSVCKGIKLLLDSNGVFVVQFMYADSMMRNIAFDTIYHEHLCYYTLTSLLNLLNKFDLDIFDAYWSPIHSGSMIAKFCHTDSKMKIKTERCSKALGQELFLNEKIEKDFIEKTNIFRLEFIKLIYQLKNDGKKIYALGAPAKGNTLLNYCGMNNILIDKAVEVNDMKIGLYTPGTHIPIVRQSNDDIPDYFLLLSHNFSDEIMKKFEGKNVKFIIPFKDKELIKII